MWETGQCYNSVGNGMTRRPEANMRRAGVCFLLAFCFVVLSSNLMCMAQMEIPKPIKGVPFTAYESGTKTQGTDVIVITGTIARRSDSSIYWYLVTTKNGVELQSDIFIDDAAKQVALHLFTRSHTYTSDPWQGQPADFVWHPTPVEQYLKLSGGEGAKRTLGDEQSETLGIRQVAGLQTVGFHITKPIGTIDRWYSPELDMNLDFKAHEAKPGGADSEMTITQLRLGEPDPKLFDIPPGYTEVYQKTLNGHQQPPAN
jgi:hypothetical protein